MHLFDRECDGPYLQSVEQLLLSQELHVRLALLVHTRSTHRRGAERPLIRTTCMCISHLSEKSRDRHKMCVPQRQTHTMRGLGRSTYLGHVEVDPPVLDTLGLGGVVIVQHVGHDALIDHHHQGLQTHGEIDRAHLSAG